jgi:hypothetical protein
MNHTTKTLTIAVGMLAVIAVLIGVVGILGYLQEVKAATKTYSQSMDTSCGRETDEPRQTIVCIDEKPCHATTKHTP